MNRIELKALGKINLGLDVLGRRENGYHDVRMVMQTIYLYDQITIKKRRKSGITFRSDPEIAEAGRNLSGRYEQPSGTSVFLRGPGPVYVPQF